MVTVYGGFGSAARGVYGVLRVVRSRLENIGGHSRKRHGTTWNSRLDSMCADLAQLWYGVDWWRSPLPRMGHMRDKKTFALPASFSTRECSTRSQFMRLENSE